MWWVGGPPPNNVQLSAAFLIIAALLVMSPLHHLPLYVRQLRVAVAEKRLRLVTLVSSNPDGESLISQPLAASFITIDINPVRNVLRKQSIARRWEAPSLHPANYVGKEGIPPPAHDQFHPRVAKSRNLKEERLIGPNTDALPPPVSMLPKLHKSAGGGTFTWRQKLGALGSVRQFLQLVWLTHRGYAAATVLLRLFRASIPIATLWVAKLIIDTVVAARMGRPISRDCGFWSGWNW